MRQDVRTTPSRRRADREPGPAWTRRAVGPLLFVAMALVYLVLSQAAALLFKPVTAGAGLAPVAGVTVGALLLSPRRLWGWLLGGLAAAALGGDLAHGYPVAVCLVWTLGNVVQPLVGATLLRRAGNPHGALTPLPRLLRFLALAVVAGPLVGASIGTVATVAGLGYPLAQVWPKFVVGEALGVLVVAPVLLTWRTERFRRSPWEAAALAVGALAVTILVFTDMGGRWAVTMAYLLIPFFTWAALRFGIAIVALLSLVVSLLATEVTWAGTGAFANAVRDRQDAVTLLQMFLVVAVASALILASLVSDLRDRRQMEAELRYQASHDLLTGLPNRAVLAEALGAALRSPDADGVALMVCDVDHFKRVNDTYGHSVGDMFLVTLAGRLRSSVRADDLVARISGDEFVVLLQDADRSTVDAVCDRILTTVCRPVQVSEGASTGEIVASLSVGLAHGGSGTTPEQLFGGADAALFEAKRRGRGQLARADESLLVEARERVDIERDLATARLDQLVVCRHQPQVETATGRLLGLASVPCWELPGGRVLPADRFLPVVASSGRSAELLGTVLAQTLQAQRRWQEALGFVPAVAVPVGAALLADGLLPEAVCAAVRRSGGCIDTLWLEVPHATPLDAAALATLRRLGDTGVHLAVADFGIGWSAMGLLSAHRWELLKLHRSFLPALGRDEQGEAVVAATITMAHALGIRAAADGVATPLQLERLTALGCDVVQGDAVGPPLPPGRAVERVDRDGRWAMDGRWPAADPSLDGVTAHGPEPRP